MSFNENYYQQNFPGLINGTSGEILFAIEIVTGESFEQHSVEPGEPDDHLDGEIIKNAAYQLWEEGGRELEILAALPTEHAEDGEEIFFGNDLFAKFDGEKWSLAK